MCGFAGVIAWDDRYRVSHETLRKMSAAIAHRGPDGEGFHITQPEKISPDNPQVALAFRRLAVLDPDPRSDQPFTDGRHWLVFNGEIYNFRELKKELSALSPDYEWRTTGDTEVLLRAYAVWGEKCVEHLNGMFAFAVWDTVEKSLFLARDRMGQKPLYVQYGNRKSPRLVFASEVTAIRDACCTNLSEKDDWLARYLSFGALFPIEPFNAHQLIANRCVKFQFAVGDVPPNFDLEHAHEPFGHDDYTESERSYFYERSAVATQRTAALAKEFVATAVERQLVSDVPLGVFLSGGIDSSVIAFSARQHGPIRTFSVGFDDPRYDESGYARDVAKHLGAEHHEFRISPNVMEDLPLLAATFGVPFADSSALPTHYLARETRQHVKVALSGDGGDELFGGYDRYRAMRFTTQFVPKALAHPIGRLFRNGNSKSRLDKLGRFIQTLGRPAAERYISFLRLFDSKTVLQLLGKDLLDNTVEWSFNRRLRDYPDAVTAAMAYDRSLYLPNDLLTKVDRCSMLHGLEVRSPFMDHELVQFAAGLTTDQLLKGGPKRMLREAFKDDLPAWVFKRKKMGFAVPIGEWFRGELRPMLRDTLFSSHAFGRSYFDMKVVERLVEEHESKRLDHSQRLYALLMLELWWNTVRLPAGLV